MLGPEAEMWLFISEITETTLVAKKKDKYLEIRTIWFLRTWPMGPDYVLASHLTSFLPSRLKMGDSPTLYLLGYLVYVTRDNTYRPQNSACHITSTP